MKTVQMGPISTLKRRATHLALGLSLAVTLAFGTVMPALGADGTMAIEGGSLNFSPGTALAMSTVSVGTGALVTSTGSLVIGVTDYTGTGAGWKLQVASAGFQKDGIGTALPGFKITNAAAVHTGGEAFIAPTPTITNLAAITGTAATFYNASADTGLGSFDVTATFSQPVAANTLIGDYTATITVTNAAMPE